MTVAKTDDYTPVTTLYSSSLSPVHQESESGTLQGVGSVTAPASGAPVLLNLVVRAKREWEATFDAVSDLIVLTDEQGIIRRCNRAVREALQTSYRDIVGRFIGEVFCGTGEAVPLLFLKPSRVMGKRQEMQFPRLPGWFAVTCHPLRTTENSGIAGIVYTFTDITERKRAEAAHQQEARVTAALARVGQELIATLEPSTILHRLCWLICEILECDASHTFLFDATRQAYQVVAGHGDTPEHWVALKVVSLPRDTMLPLVQRLAREDAIELQEQESPDIEPLLPFVRASTVLCVALRRGEQVIGIQTASYRSRQQRFTPL
ncbi:MAG: PAS domain-containing protein, partial [Candidatus Binatia bacterium]|nr:PAS domain-containing protein [Candidatus Binatia bacterium]